MLAINEPTNNRNLDEKRFLNVHNASENHLTHLPSPSLPPAVYRSVRVELGKERPRARVVIVTPLETVL